MNTFANQAWAAMQPATVGLYYPTSSVLFSSDENNSWYDTGSTDTSSSSSDEQIEITLDERTGIWTGKN